jgi:hypothetical protein
MVTLAKPGPIATRLVKELRKVKSGRVVDLGAFRGREERRRTSEVCCDSR